MTTELSEEEVGALKSFIERVENLEEEKSTLSSDIQEIYKEAQGVGLDVRGIKQVIRLRKQDKHTREQNDQILTIYREALDL